MEKKFSYSLFSVLYYIILYNISIMLYSIIFVIIYV